MLKICRKVRAGHWMLAALVICLLAADEGGRPLERLDPLSRAKVISALVGLVILGLAMIALIYLGARFTRRYMRGSASSVDTDKESALRDAWAAKTLASSQPLTEDGDDL